MSKKTAIEWLSENYLPLKRGIELGHEHTVKVVEQAKEMEKQQIIDAYGVKVKHSIEQGTTVYTQTFGEQYYNEIYNK
jgi:hypothetical protein